VLPGVTCPNWLVFDKIETYVVSESSPLSVAEPKYFKPFALAKVLSWPKAAGKKAAKRSVAETCIVPKRDLKIWLKKKEGRMKVLYPLLTQSSL
jgi:hypothetical protein